MSGIYPARDFAKECLEDEIYRLKSENKKLEDENKRLKMKIINEYSEEGE